MAFVRRWKSGDVEYLCAGICDIRGPQWEEWDHYPTREETTCPNCQAIAAGRIWPL